ncbi:MULTISPECIES: hypothetical protein [unclassified Mesorhizobium]|uniref:hypothetical protein n=1 Tax=unclassified Mesorhizobium TaxID=325217 RepID=UPI0015E31635|nr:MULTISPECIES: hypothetical protein [unclassified Mesorhizobium]MBZ9739724.1 hypothetical protein [Mesorhizobium sp. CO1-1-4]MBZ9805012.1 hypothetical protein [Mesorhizobium sp. ES1-6]
MIDLVKESPKDLDSQQLFIQVRDQNGKKLPRLSVSFHMPCNPYLGRHVGQLHAMHLWARDRMDQIGAYGFENIQGQVRRSL